jgi:hypothetical protein
VLGQLSWPTPHPEKFRILPLACSWHHSIVQKHRKLLIALACLTAIAAIVALARYDPQPRYMGRLLSEWLHDAFAASGSPENIQPEQAVRTIGTNAIPWFVNWINYERGSWQRTARSVLSPSLSRSFLGEIISEETLEEKSVLAVIGFSFLGTNAAPAIPELSAMMRDSTRPQTARRCVLALGHIGGPALPVLAQALAETNFPCRVEIVELVPHLRGPHPFRPVLETALADQDPRVRSAATNVLQQIAPQAHAGPGGH